MTHPTHRFNDTERCTACGFPAWVSGALQPCTKAEVLEEKPCVDWFAANRSAG